MLMIRELMLLLNVWSKEKPTLHALELVLRCFRSFDRSIQSLTSAFEFYAIFIYLFQIMPSIDADKRHSLETTTGRFVSRV